MARTSSPAAPAYEPQSLYQVRFSRPLTREGFEYLPRHLVEMTGAVLNEIVKEQGADVIAAADPR